MKKSKALEVTSGSNDSPSSITNPGNSKFFKIEFLENSLEIEISGNKTATPNNVRFIIGENGFFYSFLLSGSKFWISICFFTTNFEYLFV